MRLPVMPRWLAPVLVVTFLLLTGWAAYNLSSVSSAAQAPGPTGPPLEYEGSGTYGYNASLAPNTLFNSTNVSGTNLTLFVSITKWVNVTFVSTVALGPASPATLDDHFAASLSTPDWSRSLGSSVHEKSSANTTSLTVTDHYDLNLSQIESLTNTIDSQLNYSPASFTVGFTASVTGSVSLGVEVAPLVLDSWLNLTFRGPVILPTGVPASEQGNLTGADAPAGSGNSGALTLAWLELLASVGALAAAAWFLWSTRKVEGPNALPDLDRLIEPYQEVIARTSQVPDGAKVLPVDRWEDLVKVADTLGRPILRPLAGTGNPSGSDFYVFDGTLAYLYRYPRPTEAGPSAERTPSRAPAAEAKASAPPTPAPPTPASPTPGSPIAASAPPRVTVRPTPPAGARPGIPDTVRPKRLPEQIEIELNRIRGSSLDAASRQEFLRRVALTLREVSSASPEEGQRAVEELRQSLDRALRDPRRRL